ncbi:GntR family transcriptional regulator [Bacillus sp. FSL K6-3431]|uniref:GntR family transcriptional regulator n=1 Tax=Bacillus sp. FSL K6-3431 TaxID=2921500 RepID=UPI0030FAEF64
MKNNKLATKNTLYMEVKGKILQFIKENNFQAHDVLPSEAELAEKYGVSRMTCKLALQQLVDEGVVYRLPRRGTFVAEYADTKFDITQQKKRSQRLGLVVPHIDEYVSQIITSIVHEAEKNGYEVLLKISDNQENKENLILSELSHEYHVDGIILFPSDRKECGDGLLRLKLDKFPVVILDREFREIQIDSVYHDHFQGTYNITKYLIEQGHRQIGYISHNIEIATSREERFRGFIQCMLDHNISFQYQRKLTNVEWAHGNDSGSVKVLLPNIEQYLKNNRQLTAVLCMDDYLAAYVVHAARRIGLQVPDDLSITGFLDINVTQFLPVSLTTMRQPTNELGEEAVRLLLRRMDNTDIDIQHIQIPTELVIRDSVRNISNTTTNI